MSPNRQMSTFSALITSSHNLPVRSVPFCPLDFPIAHIVQRCIAQTTDCHHQHHCTPLPTQLIFPFFYDRLSHSFQCSSSATVIVCNRCDVLLDSKLYHISRHTKSANLTWFAHVKWSCKHNTTATTTAHYFHHHQALMTPVFCLQTNA